MAMELEKLDYVQILTRHSTESPDRSAYFEHSDCVRFLEDSGTGASEDLGNGNQNNEVDLIDSPSAFDGDDVFRFRSPSPSTVYRDRTVSLAWTNVDVTLRTQITAFLSFRRRRPFRHKHVLCGVNGFAKPGNLLAVIGQRGSGKSTLLHTLSFHRSFDIHVEGDIMANSEPADSSITSLMACIPQEDIFLPALTVKEHLQIQASLRIRSLPDSQKMKKVDDILDEIELIDCANDLIGTSPYDGISMENRKKLSIATELLTNPPVLFHDEPTAGVDPMMATGVVQVLKDLALMGHTVVCTFEHATSQLYEMFDSIMVLGEGRCVYFGARHEAVQFFTSLGYPCPPYYSPADYFLQILATSPDVTRRKAIDDMCNKFSKSPFGARAYEQRQDEAFKARVRRSSSVKERVEEKSKQYTADRCTQLKVLLWRHFIMMRRRLRLVQMQFLHVMVISVLLGAAYFRVVHDQLRSHDIIALLFIIIVFLSGDTLWAAITQMRYELPLVIEERRRGLYGIEIYLISKFFAEIPGSVVYPIISSAIVYWMAGLTPGGLQFVVFMGIIVLVANAGASCGLFVSLLSKSETLTFTIATIVVLPLLILGGFLLNTRTTPIFIAWLDYLSWYKYAFEALIVNQWSETNIIEACNRTAGLPCTNEEIFYQYNVNKDNIGKDFAALIGLCIGFQLLSFIVLRIKTKRK